MYIQTRNKNIMHSSTHIPVHGRGKSKCSILLPMSVRRRRGLSIGTSQGTAVMMYSIACLDFGAMLATGSGGGRTADLGAAVFHPGYVEVGGSTKLPGWRGLHAPSHILQGDLGG